MNRRGLSTRDLITGAVVLAFTGAIIAYAFLGVLPFHHSYALRALVRDANQLRIGSPVRVAGVNEGAVTGISAGPHETTEVSFSLSDAARPIHANATLAIRPRTFLEGGFYIDLHPGTAAAPELPSGGAIPLPQTVEPVQLSQVLSLFTAPIRDDVRSITGAFATALSDGTPNAIRSLVPELSPALRDTAWVSQAARGTASGDLARLIRASGQITSSLAVQDRNLVDLVDSLRSTTAALTAQEGALGQSVRQLDGLMQDAPPALGALDATLPALGHFSDAFDPALRQAPPLVSGLTSAVDEFGTLVVPSERNRVVRAVRATLVDLPTLLVRMASEFPPLEPSAACLNERVLPVLSASAPDGNLSTGAPAWLDLLHALVGLSGNAQNFDADGYWMRYLAGGGAQTLSLPVAGGLLGALPGSSSLVGSRPVWLGPGVDPPLRPDVACTRQPLVHLSTPTGSGSGGRSSTAPSSLLPPLPTPPLPQLSRDRRHSRQVPVRRADRRRR